MNNPMLYVALKQTHVLELLEAARKIDNPNQDLKEAKKSLEAMVRPPQASKTEVA